MEIVIEIAVVIASVLCVVYTAMIGMFCYGWVKTEYFYSNDPEGKTDVSVIIPMRNEEENIVHLFGYLDYQKYPKEHTEIIIVDDCSDDDTVAKVKEYFKATANFKLIRLTEEERGSGKKKAITEGIKQAKGELIVTIDADIQFGANWLSTMVEFYEVTDAKMIVGAVGFCDDTNVFAKMQMLEFMALVTSGAGALYFNKPILCNGANLAYPKKVFEEVKGFEEIDDTATGDDVLLMYKIQKKYPKGIRFLKNSKAMVFVDAKTNFMEFISQRKRWASKKFKDMNMETKTVAVVVYFFNLFLLVLLDLGYFHPDIHVFGFSAGNVCLILFGIKCVIDFSLIIIANSFFNYFNVLVWFLLEQIVYVFYVVIVGFLGLSKKYEWKERTIDEN